MADISPRQLEPVSHRASHPALRFLFSYFVLS